MSSKKSILILKIAITLSFLIVRCNPNENKQKNFYSKRSTTNNTDHNASVTHLRSNDHSLKVYFLTCFYGLVLLVGVPGNALLVFAISSIKRDTKSLFLINLAVGDLVNLLVCVPLVITGMYVSWPFGQFVCTYVMPLTDASIANNVYTLLTISIERYRIITNPMMTPTKGKWVALISLTFWVLSYCLVGIPLMFALKVADGLWVKKSCDVIWRSRVHEIGYRLLIFIALFCVPFSIMTGCFRGMQRGLRSNSSFASTSMDLLNAERRNMRNFRLTRMLLVVVLCFAVKIVIIFMNILTRIDQI